MSPCYPGVTKARDSGEKGVIAPGDISVLGFVMFVKFFLCLCLICAVRWWLISYWWQTRTIRHKKEHTLGTHICEDFVKIFKICHLFRFALYLVCAVRWWLISYWWQTRIIVTKRSYPFRETWYSYLWIFVNICEYLWYLSLVSF